jgi:hypothetical protein
MTADEILVALAAVNARRCAPPLSEAEVRTIAASIGRYAPGEDTRAAGRPSAWAAAVPAPEFLASPETDADFLEACQLARGSITEWFSPRGLGKTLVAHAVAVKHARAGRRVLLIDRDNSRREVKRRLRAWGADETPALKVMTRDHAPALTDRAAWAVFRFADYDVVVIDSIDAATEGVGENDSAKPSAAIAPILDLAHRENGPALLLAQERHQERLPRPRLRRRGGPGGHRVRGARRLGPPADRQQALVAGAASRRPRGVGRAGGPAPSARPLPARLCPVQVPQSEWIRDLMVAHAGEVLRVEVTRARLPHAPGGVPNWKRWRLARAVRRAAPRRRKPRR